MSRESFRNEISKEFDAISGPPRPALSARVRSALAEARPAPTGPFWMAGVAAALIALIIVGALVVSNFNRRPTGIVPGGQPSASPYTTFSPAPTPSADVVPPKTVWTCSSSSTTLDYPSSAPPTSEIDAVRTGTHTGYDRITIEFKTFHVNDYRVDPQSNAKFTMGASGQPVTLRGNDGLLMTIHGADAHTAYSGPTDFKTNYVVLVEARQVQDFEGTVQWALGLSKAACYRTYFLANPSRLVIDVQNS